MWLAWGDTLGVMDAGEGMPLPLGDMDPKPSSEGDLCCKISAAG